MRPIAPASTVQGVSSRPGGIAVPVAGFLPHLDGLRALAVLLVLGYHARMGLAGGYVGVDVFLVLSGFLITSLLSGEASVGAVSLSGFWARRIRRLLPVSVLVVLVTAAAGVLVLEPQRLSRLAGDVLSSATFSANFRFLSTHGDYLGGLSLPSPLLHFWSLALEEQFYLLWPPLMVWLLQFRRRVSVVVVLLLLLGSLAASVVMTSTRPAAAYYVLPSRAWELLAGGLLALCWSPVAGFLERRGRLRSLLGSLGLTLIVGSAVGFESATPFPGVAALLPVTGTLAVLAAASCSVSGSLLSWRPLVWLGARSYGVYLWHWPVLVLTAAAGFDPGLGGRVVLVCLSVVLAAFSFRLLEVPVRASKWVASPRRSFAVGAALSSAVLGAALVVSAAAPSGRSVTEVAARRAAPSLSPAPPASSPSRPVSSTVPGPRPRVLLLGDSTLAPLRWFVDGSRPLISLGSAADFVLDAESCRRLSLRSCSGREDRRPASATRVLLESPEVFRNVVLMGGYHSTPEEFVGEFEDLLSAAGTHGVENLYVLDYRESLAFPLEGSRGRLSVYGSFNDSLRSLLAQRRPGAVPRVVVLDWNTFTAASADWFRSDGIHVNLAGSLGLGDFLARAVLADLGLPCGYEPVCSPPSTASPAGALLSGYEVVDTDEHCYEMGASRRRECRPDRLR